MSRSLRIDVARPRVDAAGVDFDELNDAMAESNRRARRGRTVARLMFALTATLLAFSLVYFVFLMPPQCMCPMFQTPPGLFGLPVGLVIGMAGSVGVATGLFWMWRIVRTDPDPDAWSLRRLHHR